MLRTDFHFELPDELIAQKPAPERAASRLLLLDGSTGQLADREFLEIERLVEPGDLLVFNDTRVLPARLLGRKTTGGRIEILLERVKDEMRAWVQIKSSRAPLPGSIIELSGGGRAEVKSRDDRLFELEFDRPAQLYFEQHGQVPLPPYIARAPDTADKERYQTVYARVPGAVAAPTAGLHFDLALLERLTARGVDQASLTLHVGIGTFAPMRVENIEEHQIHAEWIDVPADLCERILRTRASGGRVIAVGTTVVRALEAAALATTAKNTAIAAFHGDCQLFIYPGFEFRVVDAMLTNFHLPESSLLMLVCAFAGRDAVLAAYRHAVASRYRFFSYGDAMFITSPQ